jgi:hypothetical protein
LRNAASFRGFLHNFLGVLLVENIVLSQRKIANE